MGVPLGATPQSAVLPPVRQRATAGGLTVTTVELADPGALLSWLPTPTGALSWVNGGDGLVGWGEAARYEPSGTERFADAQRWWSRFTARLDVRDELTMPGTGPVAFTSLAFADTPGSSALIVPRVLIGRRDGVSWLTTVEDGAGHQTSPPHQPVVAPSGVRFGSGVVDIAAHRRSVAAAVLRIRAGELDKVVLARDLVATADRPLDERYLLTRLAERHPRCWAFAVDGLIGATPESLLCRAGDRVWARLLAGTVWPGPGVTEAELARELLDSAKNRGEHLYGVRSLVDTLTPFCASLDVPAEPSVLHLSNVTHLATEVSGVLAADTPLLELAARVHPTAATGGTPTDAAKALIAELEGLDRGGYLGPVGWIDAHGNGEFGVALRCARVDGPTATLYAGGGIVADSDPDSEVTEATAKFRAMRSVLEGAAPTR